MGRGRQVMPSEVDEHTSWFDQFASRASLTVSRAWFFAVCVLLVVVWVPSYFLFGSVDTWQLVINTATTIVTFLLVALLQNATERGDQASQHKLNAIVVALLALMEAEQRAGARIPDQPLRELRAAVGVEERESP